MAEHILLRETKPHRDPPRLAWVIAGVLGITLVAAVFSADGYRHQIAGGLRGLGTALDPRDLLPTSGPPQDTHEPPCRGGIRATPDNRRHFYVNGTANGAPFTFMVDTGATAIVFPRAAAGALKLGNLNFDTKTSTAGGEVLNARFKLKSLVIGNLELTDIDALVNAGGLDEPLLGNSWIKLFKTVEIRRDGMNFCL